LNINGPEDYAKVCRYAMKQDMKGPSGPFYSVWYIKTISS